MFNILFQYGLISLVVALLCIAIYPEILQSKEKVKGKKEKKGTLPSSRGLAFYLVWQ